MDFFFDNIAVFALLAYGLVMFAFKKLQASGEAEEDAEENAPRRSAMRRTQAEPRNYAEKKYIPQMTTFAEEYSDFAKEENPHSADGEIPHGRKIHSAETQPAAETESETAERVAYETHTTTKSFDEAFGNDNRAQKKILEMLADKNNLKRAVIASEILGKPVALRDQQTGI